MFLFNAQFELDFAGGESYWYLIFMVLETNCTCYSLKTQYKPKSTIFFQYKSSYYLISIMYLQKEYNLTSHVMLTMIKLSANVQQHSILLCRQFSMPHANGFWKPTFYSVAELLQLVQVCMVEIARYTNLYFRPKANQFLYDNNILYTVQYMSTLL